MTVFSSIDSLAIWYADCTAPRNFSWIHSDVFTRQVKIDGSHKMLSNRSVLLRMLDRNQRPKKQLLFFSQPATN